MLIISSIIWKPFTIQVRSKTYFLRCNKLIMVPGLKHTHYTILVLYILFKIVWKRSEIRKMVRSYLFLVLLLVNSLITSFSPLFSHIEFLSSILSQLFSRTFPFPNHLNNLVRSSCSSSIQLGSVSPFYSNFVPYKQLLS